MSVSLWFPPSRTCRPSSGPPGCEASVPLAHRHPEVPVQMGDDVERALLGAGRRALPGVGAAAEALEVVLTDHVHHAGVALRLPLGELAEVGDLGAEEQRGGAVGT